MAETGIDETGIAERDSTALALDEEENSIDLAAILVALLDAKLSIATGTIAVLLVATAIAFLLPSQYTSVTSFVPPSTGGTSSMASAIAGQLASLGGADLLGGGKGSGDMYAGILRSRSIASQIIKRFDLIHVYGVKKESQAEKILSSNTVVSADTKSSIITVQVTDKNPLLAHDIAGAYMEALRDTNGRMALSQSSQRRLFFSEQLAKEKNDLEDAEVEMKKTEESSGLIAPSGQTEAEIRTLAETQAQIAVREVQLAALRQSATDENPNVVRLRSEIGDLQGQLARLQRGNGSESTASIPTAKVPQLKLEYVRKEREVKYHEALFEMLSRQYEAARLDEAHDAPVVQVLDPASYPDTKSSPKRLYIMLGGAVFGFVGSCFWALIRGHVQAYRAHLASIQSV